MEYKTITDSTNELVKYLTDTYVQTEDKTKGHNYIIWGSVATNLLSQVNYYIDRNNNKVNIPKKARDILKSAVRKIGDIDIVPIQLQMIRTEKERLLFWSQNRPSLNDISNEMTHCIKNEQDVQERKISIHPLTVYFDNSYVTVRINKRDYCISSPDTLLGYKTLFTVRDYEKHKEKTTHDFPPLYRALRLIYTEEHLVQIAYNILCSYHYIYENSFLGNLRVPIEELLKKAVLSNDMEDYITKIVEYDSRQFNIFNICLPERLSKKRQTSECEKLLILRDMEQLMQKDNNPKIFEI